MEYTYRTTSPDSYVFPLKDSKAQKRRDDYLFFYVPLQTK